MGRILVSGKVAMFIGEKDKEKPETQDYITWDTSSKKQKLKTNWLEQ